MVSKEISFTILNVCVNMLIWAWIQMKQEHNNIALNMCTSVLILQTWFQKKKKTYLPKRKLEIFFKIRFFPFNY